MDYTQQPSFLMKYKIQPGKNLPPDTKQVIKVSCDVFLQLQDVNDKKNKEIKTVCAFRNCFIFR
jgi:hypothetical protein